MWTVSGDGVDGGGRSVVCPCVYMHMCVFHCDLIFFFFFFFAGTIWEEMFFFLHDC